MAPPFVQAAGTALEATPPELYLRLHVDLDPCLARQSTNNSRHRQHQPQPEKPASQVIALPPAAAILGLLDLVQFPLEPGHQVLGSLQASLFVEHVGLNFGDALLRDLPFLATMINLLLQRSPVDNFSFQGGVGRGRFAFQLGTLRLASGELIAHRVVSGPSSLQFSDRVSMMACSGATAAATASARRLGICISGRR